MGSKLANGFNKFGGILLGAAAAFTGLIFSARKAVDSFNIFQEAEANLSSITGLVGDDLKYLSDASKELSTSITEDGIKITKSSTEIENAFTSIGSKRPDLLKNKEALSAVSEDVLILSENTKDLGIATDAVTSAMNQFGLEADQSRRIINAYAAGSLEGSAEVDNLTGSMKNVGTVAADSNLSLEQTIAVLEVFGEKQLYGEEAGTKLRGSLLKLKEAGVGYASGQFNLRDALEEVNLKVDAQGTAYEKDLVKIKMFGAENVTAGTILLQNIDSYDKLTVAVTGTNTAIEQAKINTATNAAALAQANNRAENQAMILGEKLAPALTFSTNAFSYLLKMIVLFIEHGDPVKQVLTTISKLFVDLGKSISGLANELGFLEKGMLNINKVMTLISWGIKGALGTLALTLLIVNQIVKAITQTIYWLGKLDDFGKRIIGLNSAFLLLKATLAVMFLPITEAVFAIKGLKAIWDNFSGSDVKLLKVKVVNETKIEEVVNKKYRKEDPNADIIEQNRRDLEALHILQAYNAEQEKKNQKKGGGWNDADKIQAELAEKTAQWNLDAIANERKKEEETVRLWFLAEQEKIRISKESDEIRTAATLGLESLNKKKMADIDKKYWTKIHEELKRQTKIVEDNNNNLEKSREEILANQIADIEAKYQIEIDKAIASAEVSIDTKAEFLQVAADLEKQKTDEVNAFKLEKETEFAEQMFAIREEYGLITDEEYYQNELDKLDKQYNDKLILEEDYISALDKINKDYEKRKLRRIEKGLNDADAVNQAFGNMFSAMKEQELADAGDNEEAKLQIKKKYADAEMLISISNITVATALAIMKAYELGPIAGSIAAAVIGATGLIQITSAISERNKIKGLAEGGEFNVEREQDGKNFNANYNPSKRGFINKPTVLVGEEGGEYVIPAEGLRNPAISNIVGAIENSRRNKTLKFFNYDRVLGSIQKNKVKGLAEGGFVEVQKTSTSQDSSFQNDVLSSKFDALANEMKTWKSTLKAVVSISDIEYKQNLLNNTKSSATL